MKVTKKLFVMILIICVSISPLRLTTEIEAANPAPFFSISVISPNTNPARSETATLMVEQLPKIGIGIDEFELGSWGLISQRSWDYPSFPIPTYAENGFDVFFMGWGYGIDVNLSDLFDSNSVIPNELNFYQYINPEMDWALRNFSQSWEEADRVIWANEIQQLLYEDVPSCVYAQGSELYAYNVDFNTSSWDGLLWSEDYQSMENWTIPGETVFQYGLPHQFEEFHPYFSENVCDKQWFSQIYDGLLARSHLEPYDRGYAPRLATYTSANGLNFSLQINPNAKFADGHVLNASDVEYSYNLLIDPLFDHPDYDYWVEYVNANSVSIISEFEVEISFLKEYAFQKKNLAVPILPKHIWSGITQDTHETQAETWANDDTLDSNLMGAGPYYLEDYNATTEIIHLNRNDYFDDWAGTTPYFEDVYFEYYSTKESALSALATGDLDMMDGQFSPKFSEVPLNATYTQVGAGWIQEMVINCLHPYLGTGELCPIPGPDSARYIRKAMNHIFPRNTIINEIFESPTLPGVIPYPSIGLGFNDSFEPYEYSLELAKSYMEAAGFVYHTPKFSIPISAVLGILALIAGTILLTRKSKRNVKI